MVSRAAVNAAARFDFAQVLRAALFGELLQERGDSQGPDDTHRVTRRTRGRRMNTPRG
jgi:hypothetical protein